MSNARISDASSPTSISSMPREPSHRPSHSFFPFTSYASHHSPSPSCQPHPSRPSSQPKNIGISSTLYVQSGRYGPQQPTPQYPTETISTRPQIQMNGLPLDHTVPHQPLVTFSVAIPKPSPYPNTGIPFSPPLTPPPTNINLSSDGWPFDAWFTDDAARALPNTVPRQALATDDVTPSSYFNTKIPFSSPLSPPPTDINLSSDRWVYDTWFTDDATSVLPNAYPNQPRSPLLINQSLQLPLSTPQYGEEHNLVPQPLQCNTSALSHATRLNTNASTPAQSTRIYPAPSDSVNHDYSMGVQHHPSYHTKLRHFVEQVTEPRARFTEPSSVPEQISPENQRQSQEHHSHGMFNRARNFSLPGAVLIDNNAPNFTLNMSDNNFMTSFLKETIPRAEFDSSDPNMPLRCHPGTRVQIIKRCQDFILNREGRPRLRWVVGGAGVGKSAIMQSVAQDESGVLSNVIVGATIFFSINGRQDGTKAITTIAYQLAVKLYSYRLFVQREVTHDPALLQKSLSRQFKKFVVEPFIHQCILDRSSRLLIIIDGLDECANLLTQQELLGLISDFCISYPTSPIVWMIASRPEYHITSFFSQPKVAGTYEKEEILVDLDEAQEDVKFYLREIFREVQMASITLQQLAQWPSEGDFSKIIEASGGLFAYASTVARYTSDPAYGDPVGQLDDVLEFIEAGTKSNLSGQDHPMAQLDALYGHIMSKIPAKVMANTRKLLLLHAVGSGLDLFNFHLNCNLLGMTENAAYSATHHIRSVAIVPGPAEAPKPLKFFHKSFRDYLQDFERSGFSRDIQFEAKQLVDQLALRIFEQAPDGVYLDGASELQVSFVAGIFKNCPGTRDNIAVSWPAVGEDDDCRTRLYMFEVAALLLTQGLKANRENFRSLLCMHVLTTCFTELSGSFPLDAVRDFPFDEFRRRDFMEHGILKQVPLETIDYGAIMIRRYIRLDFKGPIANAWNKSCRHPKKGHSGDWSTRFKRPDAFKSKYCCSYCFKRLKYHLKTRSPDHLIAILDFTTEHRVIELRFVDPGDGVSEWTYHFITGKDIEYMSDDDGGSDDEYIGDNDESDEDESDVEESDID